MFDDKVECIRLSSQLMMNLDAYMYYGLTLIDDEGARIRAECVVKRNQHHGICGTCQVCDDILQENMTLIMSVPVTVNNRRFFLTSLQYVVKCSLAN